MILEVCCRLEFNFVPISLVIKLSAIHNILGSIGRTYGDASLTLVIVFVHFCIISEA